MKNITTRAAPHRREQTVAMAQEQEKREEEKEMVGVELRQGDLVLLRRFQVVKHHGLKVE